MHDFNMVQFCKAYHFNMLTVFNSLKILQRAGYIEYSEEANLPSRAHFIVLNIDLYIFQVKNEQFDSFIKLLLRSYTGFFTEYVLINEQLLAQRASVSVDLVYQYLNKLNHLKIIHYIPHKKTPLIQYIRPREEVRYMRLPHEVYRDRKKQYEERIQSIIEYAEYTHVCRSRFLLHYFGQKHTQDCGQCDVCIEKKKRGLSNSEADRIEDLLKKTLSEPMAYSQIESALKLPENKWLDIFNWLADNQIIYPLGDGIWQCK